MKKEFNKNDWQGKRKEQIEFTQGVTFFAIISVIVVLVLLISTN